MVKEKVEIESGPCIRPLRILHCIPGLQGGGAERQLSYLSAELSKRGLDIHVAYHLRGSNLGMMEDSSVTLHKLRSRGNYDPLLLWRLVRTVWKVKPDLIQTWLPQMDILGGLAALLTNTPFLMTERSVTSGYGRSWKAHLRLRIGAQAVLVVANSETGRQYWISRKAPMLVKVIRNGIPMEQINQSPPASGEEIGIDRLKELILFAGRYDNEKNVLTLLDAIRQVLSERPNGVALMCGQGPLKNKLIAIVKHFDLQGRVLIKGYTTQLWGWMKRANLFVSVSLFEGSPNVVLEAAALGCPIVLSAIPGHRELLNEDSAFFVAPDSPSDIARGITESLSDPEGAKRKAESAKARLSRFTIDSATSQYLALYKAVLDGSELTSCLE